MKPRTFRFEAEVAATADSRPRAQQLVPALGAALAPFRTAIHAPLFR